MDEVNNNEEGVLDVSQHTNIDPPSAPQQDAPPPIQEYAPPIQDEAVLPPTQEAQVEAEEQVQTETEQPVVNQPTFGDSEVLTYLSEKLGSSYTSFDDLKPKESEPVELHPQLQEYQKYLEETGRPLGDWVKAQKDYTESTDTDVVRDYLQMKYPTFSSQEINLEMQQYKIEEDYDDEGVTAKKSLQLKKDALFAREELSKHKSQFSEPVTSRLSKEQEADLSLAQKYRQQTQDTQKQQEIYNQNIQSTIKETEGLPLQLSDDAKIDFRISDEDKTALPDFIAQMSHWYNEDGSFNYSNVVSDSIKIKNFDKMIQLAYEQGLSQGTDSTIKDTKNVNIDKARTNASGNTKRNDIIIEGAEKMRPNGGLKVRFNRKR